MRRRTFLKACLLLPAAASSPAVARPLPAHGPGGFDYAWLKGRARALAEKKHEPPPTFLPAALAGLSYDEYQSIRFRPEHALWSEGSCRFRVQFSHRGPMFREVVRMYEVIDGRAQEIRYSPAMFDWGKSGVPAGALPQNLGLAGFRVQYQTDWKTDVAAFLGASYFRAIGGDQRQYGISARALAIDIGLSRPEEFPRFSECYFVRPGAADSRLTVYTLLESPSVTGAYRFDIFPGPMLIMEIDGAIYPRRSFERLGIAPLTSMFLCGENDRRVGGDWRPEIHDSDGLAILTGSGERIWRPLVNPSGVRVNSFLDRDWRGFGLLQRDRNFDHYQDDGAHYHLRPSVWVEPRGDMGEGAVQLVELPAPDETYDNIVVFWNPARAPRPGREILTSYRLHWGTVMPLVPRLAQVVATRTGIGGVVGHKRRYFSWRFAVDFAGGELASLADRADVEPVITASRGIIEIASARPQAAIAGFRAMFDIRPTDDSIEPVDLRLYLRLNGQPLTETWLYQWTPPPPAERRY